MTDYSKKMRLALLGGMMLSVSSLSAQVVKGNVTDTSGEPIIGATIMEDGTSGNGTVTDIDGNFTLNLKGSKKAIRVTYVGMKPKTVKVGDKTQLAIKMEDDANNLNDVVVIGYGTVRKKDLTGSVASIDSKTGGYSREQCR